MKSIKLKQSYVFILVFVLLFGGIGMMKGLGLWKTESDKTPAKYTSGIFAGTANPADIRGSYSFQEVADAFEMDPEILKKAFLIDEAVAASEVLNKDLEGMYAFDDDIEIGNGSVKAFVALYKGLPYDYEGDYLFDAGVALIREVQPVITAEMEIYFNTHTVSSETMTLIGVKASVESETISEGIAESSTGSNTDISEASNTETSNTVTTNTVTTNTESSGSAESSSDNAGESNSTVNKSQNSTDAEHSETESATMVKGNTTFQQVLDLGVSKEEIEGVIGASMPQSSMPVRDYCTANGLQFSVVKTELQALIDSK